MITDNSVVQGQLNTLYVAFQILHSEGKITQTTRAVLEDHLRVARAYVCKSESLALTPADVEMILSWWEQCTTKSVSDPDFELAGRLEEYLHDE